MFWVLKRDGSIEYPQRMFWLRNKNILFWYALLTIGLCPGERFGKLDNHKKSAKAQWYKLLLTFLKLEACKSVTEHVCDYINPNWY